MFLLTGNLRHGYLWRTELETLFNTGDAIGFFAIKNGAIANAINNVKLTYKKTGIAMGDWNPPAGTTLYWTAGMSYIAYYPIKKMLQ